MNTTGSSVTRADEPTAAALLCAAVAISTRTTNGVALTLRPQIGGAALRVLLGIDAAADERGRYRTAYGACAAYEEKGYYILLKELIAAGYLTNPPGQLLTSRYRIITPAGRAAATKARRRMEEAARLFIAGSRY